jgi:hypothetical protein
VNSRRFQVSWASFYAILVGFWAFFAICEGQLAHFCPEIRVVLLKVCPLGQGICLFRFFSMIFSLDQPARILYHMFRFSGDEARLLGAPQLLWLFLVSCKGVLRLRSLTER